MKYYWVKTNSIIKWLLPNFLWEIKTDRKVVYLTFDDGPTPEITNWVLSQLQLFDAKATFFCIGNNIERNPEIFDNMIRSGHAIGNHTQDHTNGWNTKFEDYIKNVKLCADQIATHGLDSKLFRPPYGKLKMSQSKKLLQLGYKIVMWDILSADFDQIITPEDCLNNVLRNIAPGSIIIFHDSVKAFANLEYALPKTLAFLESEGYRCEVIA